MHVKQVEMSEWDTLLPNSGFSVFHTSESLRVLDEHTSTELRLFAGFKGQEPVGLFPLFVKKRLNFRTVLSPPPGFGVRELGPLLFPLSPKRKKQETLNREFTERVMDAVSADNSTTLFWMSAVPSYRDPRPFEWAGFDIFPRHTYQLELTSRDSEEVLKSFSKSLRRDIQTGESSDVTVQLGDRESDAKKVYESIERQYRNQDKDFPSSWEYIYDMTESLGRDDRSRVYVAESADGEFLSGIIALYSNETAYFWKGGTGRSNHNFSVNSLLHWRIIRDILEDRIEYDIERYDFHTANNDRIVQYKSKFNPDLVPYYRVESAGLPMRAVKKAYRTITF